MADYDDERPDWREIDRRKDRRGQVGGVKEPGKERPTDRWKKGRVKEALDRLFMGEKGTVEHDKLYRRVHDSYGSEKFVRNVQRYFEKYGAPDDAPTLILVLDTKDEDITAKVFEKLRAVFPKLSNRHKEDIIRKLSIMALTDKPKQTRIRTDDLIEELKLSI
ncbi:MAG: hypothetical protein LBQ00_08230 [Syntrophobacterales bacterium]|jgi:hypothetical protein|nr:hypothetical protein [Syntrophobacterales bacterium]